MKRILIVLALLIVPAMSFADDLDKYVELMRSDLRTTKTAVLTEYMHLSEADGTKFWPIQREYETELAKVQDKRIAMIKDYAASYDSLTNAKANTLMAESFKLVEARTTLLKKYSGKIAKEVSPKIGVRFAQVEGFIQSLVDVQVRGEVPLAK